MGKNVDHSLSISDSCRAVGFNTFIDLNILQYPQIQHSEVAKYLNNSYM